MTGRRDIDRGREAAARRGRALLYVVGGGLTAGAMLLDLVPSLASFSSPQRVRAVALAGALFLALGRFGSRTFRAALGRRPGRPD
ncbi:MAG: hypothetical protein ABL964_00525 [Steroidobacteraceae bacterium]